MPSFHSSTVLGEYQDNPVFTWENGVEISAETYIWSGCQAFPVLQFLGSIRLNIHLVKWSRNSRRGIYMSGVRMIRMPSFHSSTVLGEYQDNWVFTWENGVEISAEEYICQVLILFLQKNILYELGP